MEEKNLIEQLSEKLQNGEAKFKYRKKSGEEREARGTLNSEIYGAEHEPKGTGRPVREGQMRYFDLDSHGWRSFIKENLMSVE